MRNKVKILAAFVVGFVLASAPAIGSTMKQWSNGNTLTAADLNANFEHLHTNMVGNHGARLINADVHAAADIAHTKLAGTSVLPQVVASTGSCTAADAGCTVFVNYGGTVAVGHQYTKGDYNVHFATPRTNATYITLVSSITPGAVCQSHTHAAGSFQVACYDLAGADYDADFSVQVFDNDLE